MRLRLEFYPRHTGTHSSTGRALAFAIAAIIGLLAAPAVAEPLSGTVLDGKTFRPIPGARVTATLPPASSGARVAPPGPGTPGTDVPRPTPSTLGVTANIAGSYSFDDIPAGLVELRITATGYEPSTQTIDVPPGGRSDQVLILFRPGAASEVIEVEARSPQRPLPPGKTDLRREELTRIPGTRGDALTSIKSLPGVANTEANGAGAGLLVIRGAAPEDSKVTIDGIEIPILYHFFGVQSVVPSELISSIDFLPGGFGAEEGRATGGIINVAIRESQAEEFDGFAEVSFVNAAAFIQGPLSREHNVQFTAGIRRSFIDLILPAVLPDDANLQFTTAPQYYDAQVRLDWQPDYRNRITLLGLVSFDLLSLLNDNINPNEPLLTGKWENENTFTRAILSWYYNSQKLDNRLVAAVGTTGLRFEFDSVSVDDSRFLRFDQTTLQLREDATWKPSSRVAVRAGGEAVLDYIESEVRFPLAPQEGSGGLDNFSTAPIAEYMEEGDNHLAAAYVAADLRPITGLTVTPGLRLDYFEQQSETTLSPRLAVGYVINDDWTARAAIGSYSQPPFQAEARQQDLGPEMATQYVLGADHRIAEGIAVQGSGFYTDRRQLIVQDEVLAATDPENAYVNRGVGRSFGAEVLVRAKLDRFFGWISYTLSRSDRIDAPDQERRLFDFDQTHNLIALASVKLGKWELGGRWQYTTGSPFTPVTDSVFLSDRNVYLPRFGAVNSARLEAAHQLDLRVDRTWHFRTWSLAAYLDITNVYIHPRQIGFTYNFDFSEQEAIEEFPFFPALGVRGSF